MLMRSDVRRKSLAIKLRKQGLSIKAIAFQLSAAQSSVSIWTRGVQLTDKQKGLLKANTHTFEVIEKRRQSRLKSERVKRNLIIAAAESEIPNLSHKDLWLIGIALYWGEGGKTQSVTRFSNGDPKMIKLMMRFFREVCRVDEVKIRGHIHLHESLDVLNAEKYWQGITGISKAKFYKTYSKPNKSSKGTRNSLPYGVCDLYVLDARLLLTIKGWIKGVYGRTQKM